jgi:hypothetical protein
VLQTHLTDLATRRALPARGDRLIARIHKLDARLSGEIALLKRVLGLLLGGVAAIVLKAFF